MSNISLYRKLCNGNENSVLLFLTLLIKEIDKCKVIFKYAKYCKDIPILHIIYKKNFKVNLLSYDKYNKTIYIDINSRRKIYLTLEKHINIYNQILTLFKKYEIKRI